MKRQRRKKYKTDKEKKHPFSIAIDDDLREAFVFICKNNNTSVSREIRQLMINYVKENGDKQ